MRKLTYYVGSTIDGCIAGADGSADFFAPGADMLEFIVAEYPDTVPTHLREQVGLGSENRDFDTVIQGRATYEPALEEGVTSPFAHLRQYVVSRSITRSPDPAVHIVSSDPLGKIKELKREEGKKIWLCGGAQLAGELLPEIDELVVKTYPVVIGTGIGLFTLPSAGKPAPWPFELVASRVFDSGAAVLSYTKK